jgi:hypothetical protein
MIHNWHLQWVVCAGTLEEIQIHVRQGGSGMAHVRRVGIALLLLALAAIWVGCAGSAPQSTPYMAEGGGDSGAPAAEAAAEAPSAGDSAETQAAPGADGPAGELQQASTGAPRSNRKIIKNGEMRLAVKDTDVAVGGITQIAADLGGYLLSSRAWTQEDEGSGEAQRYASITISVPSDRFEEALNRLRGLGVRVLDETAAGEDVTDQFVDLQSQLKNYQATRDRIRGFMEQAQTVEEALKVNEQLGAVEGEIERIQGQINYLAGRSAFSTIAVTVEPDLPPLAAAPAPAPAVWSARATFVEASAALQIVAQGFADLLIWFGVVVLPFILLILAVGWPVWRFWPRAR